MFSKCTKHGKQKRIKGLCSYDLSEITEIWWDSLRGWSAVMEACRLFQKTRKVRRKRCILV